MIQNREGTTPNQHYRGRVRSGCLTCRGRKVKCDENRPVCKNCARLKRQCRYKIDRSQHILNAVNLSSRSATDTTATPPSSELLESRCTPLSSASDENILHQQQQQEQCNTYATISDVEDLLKFDSISVQDSFQRRESMIVDALHFLDNIHEPNQPFGFAKGPGFEPVSPATLISEDIRLTTTMDKLTAQATALQPSLSYFTESINCHAITPYDPFNWQRMKAMVVELTASHEAIALAVVAVSILHKAQRYGLPRSKALHFYQTATRSYKDLLRNENVTFDVVMTTAFLLCLFEFEHQEITKALKSPDEGFVKLLTKEAKHATLTSELSLRLSAWLRILHATASRGGGMGLLSPVVHDLLPETTSSIPNLKPSQIEAKDASSHLVDMLSGPIFEFYLQIQMISTEIALLTHYHRSRYTGVDQDEVSKKLDYFSSRLRSLWENRCTIQRQTPTDLRSNFSPAIAEPIITLTGLCQVAYQAEFVEIHRVLGDPVSALSEPRKCIRQIRETVDGDWNLYDSSSLNAGLLRPLFLYAIECKEKAENEWAVKKLKDIQDLNCRGRFFAAFGEALFDAQSRKDRRVTSKYFCIWFFGEPPPYL